MITFYIKYIDNYKETLNFTKNMQFYLKIMTKKENLSIKLGPVLIDDDYEIIFESDNFKYYFTKDDVLDVILIGVTKENKPKKLARTTISVNALKTK
jgi:hypothetical protein